MTKSDVVAILLLVLLVGGLVASIGYIGLKEYRGNAEVAPGLRYDPSDEHVSAAKRLDGIDKPCWIAAAGEVAVVEKVVDGNVRVRYEPLPDSIAPADHLTACAAGTPFAVSRNSVKNDLEDVRLRAKIQHDLKGVRDALH